MLLVFRDEPLRRLSQQKEHSHSIVQSSALHDKIRVYVLVEQKQQTHSEFAALSEPVGIAVHPVLTFSSIHGVGIAAIFSGVILCSSGRSFTSASHFTRAASTRAFLSAALVFRLISNPFSWRSQSIWRSPGRKPTPGAILWRGNPISIVPRKENSPFLRESFPLWWEMSVKKALR